MAGKDYTQLCQDILENVGGKDNINGVTHCITRLRFKLKDDTKANTEVIEKLPGVIKVMSANGQYHVVVGNKVEDVYEQFIKVSGLGGGGAVAADDAEEGPKTPAAIVIDLISGIFSPILGPFCAAGIMKGILACITQFAPEFANDGAYTVLYTIADGLFYFLPVMLSITAARKFKMSEFTALGIGVALVYPTMVALTGGDVLGSVDLGFFGTFSWYATFLGIPIIMPASGYTSSVIPVLLMADMKVGTWGGAGELALFGDVATKDVDKAVAVRRVVEYLGADMADTVAMGDAKVDTPMFEACATSVCMGSGGDAAKAAADFVTTDVDEDGLWNAFSHLGLL